ncbi:MAG: SDR family NAD(P)-dependent oxidoreductase [Polyangiaceae bacterium]
MSHGRFDTPLQATLTGIKDLFRPQALAEALTPDLRLEGRTCLVTGASSGLGFAIAKGLAARGARVLMVSRSGVPERAEDVARLTGSQRVEAFQCDLSDLEQVRVLADRLAERSERRGEPLDVVVENAGVASPRAKQTPQGLEAMFVTNYLAKFYLLRRLLADGTLPNDTWAGNGAPAHRPEILFISSDSHQGASAIDWEDFGRYADFDVNKAINNYSYFKLVLNTYAVELSRRFHQGDHVDVAVHAMCPGPVDTNIIRDAPPVLKGLMRGIFAVFFRAPDRAAEPAVYMCASPDFHTTTGRYLHMFNEKPMDAKVYDAAEGARLWERSEALLAGVGFG